MSYKTSQDISMNTEKQISYMSLIKHFFMNKYNKLFLNIKNYSELQRKPALSV